MKINNMSLLGQQHKEAIHIIRDIMTASTVKLELIQGDETDSTGIFCSDWVKWVKKYEARCRQNR